jgi:hypothetical protein
MPPIFLSPIVKWTLVAIGGAIVVRWVVTEIKRVNEELDARRARVRIRDEVQRPTLRRDPASGEYRL